MNVLFIVMEFVPLNLGGVFRPLRFANGLKENGINPIIITFEINKNLKKVQNKFDFKLLDKLNKDITVYRIPLDDLTTYYESKFGRFRNIYFNGLTDNYLKAWRKNFFKILPSLIEKYDPKAVIVTCPPFSAAVLGLEVTKKYKLPFILDMRDAWAKLSISPLGSRFHYFNKKRLERKVFEQASYVITVTPQLKEIFQITHPGIPKEKFKLIYNSFEFNLAENTVIEYKGINNKEICNIGYVGSFYYSPEAREMMNKQWWKRKGHRKFQYTPVKEDWLYRSPYFFLKALQAVIKQHPRWKEKVFFHHIGETPEWLKKMALTFELEGNIILHGFQTYENTMSLQNTFDALLTTSEKVKNGPHYCLPSKLLTYLNAKKPILGFVTKGIQSDFIFDSGVGLVFDPDNLNQTVKRLEEFISQGYHNKLDTEYLQQFNTPCAMKSLLDIISDVTKIKD